MSHGHSHGPPATGANRRRLAITLILVSVYMIAEAIGGWLANSLALLADAGHMLSDAAALGLSLFALWLARRPSGPQLTYGYYRTEILAALLNGAALVAISIYVLIEAIQRIGQPPEIRGGLMMGVATGGLIINIIGLWVLHGGRNESLNVRGAWLHVLSDTLGSLQAIIAGALILLFGWTIADPIASIAISLLIIYSSWALLKETVAVIMEQAPVHLDVVEIRNAMLDLDDVVEVHDLHLWTITSGMECLSAHVVSSQDPPRRDLLPDLRDVLHKRFNIDHLTIQIEPEGYEEPPHCD